MPAVAVLPFMVLELFGYGLTEGFLAKTRLPSLVRLLLAQIAGRALRAAAVLAAFYGFGGGLPVSTIWTSITAGIFGIALQWALVPLIVFWAERKAKHE